MRTSRLNMRVRNTIDHHRRWFVLAVVAFGWFLTLGMRFVVPAVLPQIKVTFHIDNTTAGIAITVIWAGYALTQFPAGVLVDRVGERVLLATSLGGAGASIIGLSVARNVPFFLISCGLFGVATGLFGPPRGTVLTRSFPERSGTALGVALAAGSIGSAALPVLSNQLLGSVGWRGALQVVVPGFLGTLMFVWVLVPPNHRSDRCDRPVGRERAWAVVSVIGQRHVLFAVLGQGLVLFTFQGMSAFLPLYLVEVKGYDQAFASQLFALLFIGGAVFQLSVGQFARRSGTRPLLVAFSVVGMFALAGIPFTRSPHLIAGILFVLGTRMAFAPLTNSFVISQLSGDVQGSAWGLLRTALFIVGSTGSAVVGVIADRGFFDEAFFVLALVTLVAGFCYALIPSSAYRRAGVVQD